MRERPGVGGKAFNSQFLTDTCIGLRNLLARFYDTSVRGAGGVVGAKWVKKQCSLTFA